MKILKINVFLILVVSSNACNGNKEKAGVALFFNPSHVFHLNEQSFYAKLGQLTIVDTIIKSTNIDKSVLLKCFEISNENHGDLYIRVNNKDTLLHVGGLTKCSSIFVSYDDHTNLSRRKVLDEVGRGTKSSVSNTLIDSLTLEVFEDEFLEISVKQDSCWCRE